MPPLSVARPRRVAGSVPIAVLAVLLALSAAAPAQAYRFAGQRWPNREITVSNGAPAYDRAVATAIRVWNRARVGVRLVRARDARARVLIRYGRGRGGGLSGCEGVNGAAVIGYPGPGYAAMVTSVRRNCRSERLRVATAVHELGHVLGLGHDDRRCAAMNSRVSLDGRPAMCRARAAASIRRSLLSGDDIRGARALYRRRAPVVPAVFASFNPGDGTSLRWQGTTIRFRAALRNRKLGYRWRFGDPESGAANTATGLDGAHRFRESGTYTVSLSVSDGRTVIARRSQRLTLF